MASPEIYRYRPPSFVPQDECKMNSTRRYTDEPLLGIYRALSASLRGATPGQVASIEVVDPDVSAELFAGELVDVAGQACRYRGLAVWVDLAEVLGCTLGTPAVLGDGFVRLHFRLRDAQANWHERSAPSGDAEKYGVQTGFARTDKFEDPTFIDAYLDSLRFLDLPGNARILSLGVNAGAELGVFASLYDEGRLAGMELIGLDHSASAIAEAQRRYPHPSFRFEVADLKTPEVLPPGPFDLVIAINTLHSPALDGQALFRRVVTQHLASSGGVLLGFPNARYIDHHLSYGARVKNYTRPELSVLMKEVSAYKRYLHQQRFRVMITGRHTVLVTGRRPGGV